MSLEKPQAAEPAPSPGSRAPIGKKKRRGVVIVAVLVIVASLSLAGYHYNDMMVSEYKASNNAHLSAQARANAEAGIHYAAALLSDQDSYTNALGGNPWNNAAMFQGILVTDDGAARKGRFSIIGPPDVDQSSESSEISFGVTDESGKINLNAMMKADPSGELLHDMLIKLPNMTEEIANSILDWLDFDTEPRAGGAESDYYSSQTPPYRAKSGPIDSIDELLLIKGVTRDLLYGADANRNGVKDGSEGASSGFSRGWSAFLTVHSREQNCDLKGDPYVFVNNLDLTQLQTTLVEKGVSEDMAKFIIMYRQYGPAGSSGGSQSTLGTLASLIGSASKKPSSGSSSATTTAVGNIADYKITPRMGRFTINSLFDLVGVAVSVKSTDGKKTKTTIYSSPLNDPAQLRDLFTKLYTIGTVSEEPELTARVNINTAPREVLLTLPGLTENEVDKIVEKRKAASLDDVTPAWLVTEVELDLKKIRDLEKYVSTRTQVYRIQSVGYFDGKGPAIRIEAVIDTNMGRPRILAWRDLSELGKGWNENATAP